MKIISGGQTGADQAGWRAARAFGIETGGWMPKYFNTEDGKIPGTAQLHGAKETESHDYRDRTIRNVRLADATLFFSLNYIRSAGLKCTAGAAFAAGKPFKLIRPYTGFDPPRCGAWLRLELLHDKTINIAGNRESKAPGIGKWVEAYLRELFVYLGYKPA